jgi:hypothetical protein
MKTVLFIEQYQLQGHWVFLWHLILSNLLRNPVVIEEYPLQSSPKLAIDI